MKALSIRQPWASLIVAGVKDIENRTWPTAYRGELYIHAALKVDKEGMEMVRKMGLPQELIDSMHKYTGGIIGKADLVDCVKESKSDWFEGPYGFVLKNADDLGGRFVPLKGQLGIFDFDGEKLVCFALQMKDALDKKQ